MNCCKLCLDSFEADDLDFISSEVQRDLEDIVIFSLDSPLTNDDKICKSCSEHIHARTRLKSMLRSADDRIREIHYGAMFKPFRPKYVAGKGWQLSQVDRHLRTLSNIKGENASSLGPRDCYQCYAKQAPSIVPKNEFEPTDKVKTERFVELESELWEDDVKRTSNKENE